MPTICHMCGRTSGKCESCIKPTDAIMAAIEAAGPAAERRAGLRAAIEAEIAALVIDPAAVREAIARHADEVWVDEGLADAIRQIPLDKLRGE